MRKLIFFVWIVSWSEPQLPRMVPCPNAQVMVNKKDGAEYIAACLQSQEKYQQKEFKVKKEAEEYGKALKLIGIMQVEVKETIAK